MLFIMLPNQDLRADLPGMHSKINTIPATSNTQTYCLSLKITPITPMCLWCCISLESFLMLFFRLIYWKILEVKRGCCSLWIPSIRFIVVPCAYFVCDMLWTDLSLSFWWPARLWTLWELWLWLIQHHAVCVQPAASVITGVQSFSF